MSLVGDVRPISKSSPSRCWKIRYNSRSDTVTIMPGLRWAPIAAGHRHVQHSGTPQATAPLRTTMGSMLFCRKPVSCCNGSSGSASPVRDG